MRKAHHSGRDNPPPTNSFLDEPTTGIDVASARQIRQLIANLHSAGTTIFLTTHYIEEAERLCDRIAFIVSGKIVRINSVKNLLQPFKEKQIMEVSCSNTLISMIDELSHAFPELEFSFLNQSVIRVESNQPIRVGPLIRFLEDHGTEVTEARKIRPSLEDIFVKITGIEAGAMRKEKEKIGGGSQ